MRREDGRQKLKAVYQSKGNSGKRITNGIIYSYMRKMAIDGYVINLDLSDVREMVSLLGRCSNNLNQYAKRTNETGSVYAADIEDLRVRFDGLWDAARKIMHSLAKIK